MKSYFLLLTTVLIAATVVAQNAEPPVAPAIGVEDTAPAPARRYEDNVRPLSGVQNFDLGGRVDRMNVLIPAFTMSGSYGTNPANQTGSQGETVWGYTTNIGGSLQMMRGSTARLFSLAYQGSAQLNSYDSDVNTQVHSLDLTQTITSGRWTYVLGNTLAYQPNAYGAHPALLYPGIDSGTPGGELRPGITPNDSILNSPNSQISNTSVGQITYGLSRVSSLTGSFSYGMLHFLEGDLLDTRQLSATGGFDRRFGRNTIGVSYTYSRFMYDHFDESFDTNTIHLTYGRRLLGRFSMTLAAGPTFRNRNTGSMSEVSTDVSGSATLQYASTRSTLAMSYARAVTGGSGVTAGAITDSIAVSGDRKLSRTFSANANAGYTINSEMFGAGTDYKTLFVGAGFARTIGRYLTFGLGYRGQQQTGNLASAEFTSHSAVVSMQWRFRPVRID